MFPALAGYGVLAGVSFRSPARGFDLDLNLTWRKRPSRVVEGLLYNDLMALAPRFPSEEWLFG